MRVIEAEYLDAAAAGGAPGVDVISWINQKAGRSIRDVLCPHRLIDGIAAADEDPATLGRRRRPSMSDDDVERLLPDLKP
jgi:hypothetical protein